MNEVVALGVDHVTFSNDTLSIFKNTSKADQLLFGSKDPILLFQSLQYYLALCTPIQNVSYISHINAKPLTQYQFSSMLKKALQFLHIQSITFKTHSFRIGGKRLFRGWEGGTLPLSSLT